MCAVVRAGESVQSMTPLFNISGFGVWAHRLTAWSGCTWISGCLAAATESLRLMSSQAPQIPYPWTTLELPEQLRRICDPGIARDSRYTMLEICVACTVRCSPFHAVATNLAVLANLVPKYVACTSGMHISLQRPVRCSIPISHGV